MSLIDGIKNELSSASFIQTAKEIAAILSLLYLSVKAYSMILGEGKLEIMPLFRPFLITLIIVNFGLFSKILGSVGDQTQHTARTNFEANAAMMDNMLMVKQEKMDSIKILIDRSRNSIEGNLATADKAAINDQSVVGWDPTAGIKAQLGAWMTVETQLLWTRLSMWLQGIIMWVVIALMKGVMYCLFFLQMIFLHILLIIGPIAFAFSIMGAFGSSWIEWVKHYISVSFWGTIGFIVMNIVCAVIAYGLKQEIARLTAILNNGRQLFDVPPGQVAAPTHATALFFASITHMDNFLGFLLIGLITAIGGIASTPLVANWIIGGATNAAMKGMATGGSMIAGSAAGAVGAGAGAATGGVGSAVSAGVSAAGKGVSSSGSVAKIAPPPQPPPPARPR